MISNIFEPEKASIYQLNLRMFTPEGTLKAATKLLPMLSKLGPRYIQLMALAQADESEDRTYWSKRQIASGCNNPKNSYRIRDYFSVDEEYGTNEDLKEFVAQAHRVGIRVLLDLVYLHCGPNADILKEHPEYIQRNSDGNMWIGGDWCFPRFDYSNPEVREYLWSNMVFWVKECDVDGYRCDVGDAIPVDFWVEGVKRIRAIKPDLLMVNEGTGNQYFEAFDVNYFYDGCFDAVPVAEGKMTALEFRNKWDAYRKELPIKGRNLHFIDNHDITSDQGVMRNEKRIGSAGVEALMVMDFTLDGVPFVYNGCEVADDLKHNIFSNRFFGRDPAINWANLFCNDGIRRFSLMQKLFRLRSESEALHGKELVWCNHSAPEQVLMYIRPHEKESLFVAINMRGTPVSLKLDNVPEGVAYMEPILKENVSWNIEKNEMTMQLLGYGYVVASYKGA